MQRNFILKKVRVLAWLFCEIFYKLILMLKKRLIASLLWRDGILIQSKKFRHTNAVGTVYTAIDFFNSWSIDEIILLNVSRTKESQFDFHKDVSYISRRCFVPLTIGGWISSTDEIRQFLSEGADKISINTHAALHSDFITESAERFGKQCIVVSIDTMQDADSSAYVSVDRGQERLSLDPIVWAQKAEKMGAGEILLRSIDQDGTKSGYDLNLLRSVCKAVSVPVIASGGAGEWQHFADAFDAGASAVAGGNIFHHTEQSTKKAKNYLFEHKYPVRVPEFYDALLPRDPIYKITV